MTYKITDTTDNKYEGNIITTNEPIVGNNFSYQDINFVIEKKIETIRTIKLISSNYIITLEKII